MESENYFHAPEDGGGKEKLIAVFLRKYHSSCHYLSILLIVFNFTTLYFYGGSMVFDWRIVVHIIGEIAVHLIAIEIARIMHN
jgi:hypothetical protein